MFNLARKGKSKTAEARYVHPGMETRCLSTACDTAVGQLGMQTSGFFVSSCFHNNVRDISGSTI